MCKELSAYNKSKELAQLAAEGTGTDFVEHKLLINQVGSIDVYNSIKNEKTIGVIIEDTTNKTKVITYPVGIVAAPSKDGRRRLKDVHI